MAIRANRLRGIFLRRGWREEDVNELVELDAEANAETLQAAIDELEARLERERELAQEQARHERELAAAERARLDDKVEGGYERLLAEIRGIKDRFEQRMDLFEQQMKQLEQQLNLLREQMKLLEQRMEQKIEERGNLTDERSWRRIAQLGLWIAGLVAAVTATVVGLAAAGVI